MGFTFNEIALTMTACLTRKAFHATTFTSNGNWYSNWLFSRKMEWTNSCNFVSLATLTPFACRRTIFVTWTRLCWKFAIDGNLGKSSMILISLCVLFLNICIKLDRIKNPSILKIHKFFTHIKSLRSTGDMNCRKFGGKYKSSQSINDWLLRWISMSSRFSYISIQFSTMPLKLRAKQLVFLGKMSSHQIHTLLFRRSTLMHNQLE